MCRTANRDLPAFDQIQPRLARLHANIVATAQHRLDLPTHDLYGHRALQRDCVAFDRPDQVIAWIVGARRLRSQPGTAGQRNARAKDYNRGGLQRRTVLRALTVDFPSHSPNSRQTKMRLELPGPPRAHLAIL